MIWAEIKEDPKWAIRVFILTPIQRKLRWITFIKASWFRNHPLGMRGFITNKKGAPAYCYRCGNFSNLTVKRYWIFMVPICNKHYEEKYGVKCHGCSTVSAYLEDTGYCWQCNRDILR